MKSITFTECNQYINLVQCYSSKKKKHPEHFVQYIGGLQEKKKSKLNAASTDTQKHLSASHFYI